MDDFRKKIAVLVVSCDAFSDIWKPFFYLFQQFWSDCPFKIYLISNNESFDFPNVNMVPVGDDVSWSDNLLRAIEQLDEDYFLLCLDDFVLIDHIQTDKVVEIFRWMVNANANNIRINPCQKPDRPFNETVGICSKGTIYRTSTISSVWKREVLLNLLKSGETAWDFEIYGSNRSDNYDGFYITWKNYFPTMNCIIKGKWQRKAIEKLHSFGLEPDLARREVMTQKEEFFYSLKIKRSRVLNCFSFQYRSKIKDIFLRGHYNYQKTN